MLNEEETIRHPYTYTHTYTVKNKYFIFQVNIDCMFII